MRVRLSSALRPRWRYVTFKVWSERVEVLDFEGMKDLVVRALLSVLGPTGTGRIGPWLVRSYRDLNAGILRVRRGQEEEARAALSLYRRDPELGRVFIEVLGTSGTIKGAERYLSRVPKCDRERVGNREFVLYENGEIDVVEDGRVVAFASFERPLPEENRG
ncbi:Rpp14/Pop5 family protein [Methanopyrus sp. SNP6]|uniref:Rpp14/Pop5 family protein n=1 Tax=Methanopyrus sp. SNP6 TaxID=1937005 RepID=UPI0011E5D9A0|nr:Rpp14/Pop5 family protein [Methanopyrus sp. SNP6]